MEEPGSEIDSIDFLVPSTDKDLQYRPDSAKVKAASEEKAVWVLLYYIMISDQTRDGSDPARPATEEESKSAKDFDPDYADAFFTCLAKIMTIDELVSHVNSVVEKVYSKTALRLLHTLTHHPGLILFCREQAIPRRGRRISNCSWHCLFILVCSRVLKYSLK